MVQENIIEIEKLRDKNLEALLSGYKISEFVLQNIKKDKIPKKFETLRVYKT